MSHISRSKSKLGRKVNKSLMKEAAKMVAKRLNGKVSDKVHDYRGGNSTKVDVAISTNDIPYGIGISVTPDGVEFVGDSWNIEHSWEEVKKQVNQTYSTLAYAAAVRKQGYNVEIVQRGNEIHIVAEEAA